MKHKWARFWSSPEEDDEALAREYEYAKELVAGSENALMIHMMRWISEELDKPAPFLDHTGMIRTAARENTLKEVRAEVQKVLSRARTVIRSRTDG